MKQLVKVSQMRHFEWQLIKDLGTELCTYTLVSLSIRLPIVNLSLQQGGHCWPSVVSQTVTQAPAVSPLAVTSLVWCWLGILGISWHSSSLSCLISSLPSLPGSCLFFFLGSSFPGSSFPKSNSLCAEAEYVISLLSGFWHPFQNWKMLSVFKLGIISIYRSTLRLLQLSGCFLGMQKFCFQHLLTYTGIQLSAAW